jgi:hypothetical protein
VDFGSQFNTWIPHKSFIWQMLVGLKKMFYHFDLPEDQAFANPEAAKL